MPRNEPESGGSAMRHIHPQWSIGCSKCRCSRPLQPNPRRDFVFSTRGTPPRECISRHLPLRSLQSITHHLFRVDPPPATPIISPGSIPPPPPEPALPMCLLFSPLNTRSASHSTLFPIAFPPGRRTGEVARVFSRVGHGVGKARPAERTHDAEPTGGRKTGSCTSLWARPAIGYLGTLREGFAEMRDMR
jgi:hypothetical protein